MFWYLALSLLALATAQIFLGSFVDWNISMLSTITGVLGAFMVREAALRGGLTIRHRAPFDVFPEAFLEERRARQNLTD